MGLMCGADCVTCAVGVGHMCPHCVTCAVHIVLHVLFVRVTCVTCAHIVLHVLHVRFVRVTCAHIVLHVHCTLCYMCCL